MTVASTPSLTPTLQPSAKGTFHGTGGELFLTWLINSVLTGLTLGIYAPWGKAKLFRYFYSNTEFAGSRFRFTGTGKEMFIGLLKGLGVFALLGGFLAVAMIASKILEMPALFFPVGFILVYIAMAVLALMAMFGAVRYRYSRARYREIAFRLEGSQWQFAKEGMLWLLLSMVSFGLAFPLFNHWRIGKIYNNLSFGNLKFNWDAESGAYWRLALKGYFLSMLTLGVYYFFWYPKMFAFVRGHLSLAGSRFQGEIKPGEFFVLTLTNLLLVVFTLGIAAPWVIVRTLRFFVERLELENPAMLEAALQATAQLGSTGSEGFADSMDLGVGIGF